MVIVNDLMTGIVRNNDSHHVTSCKCGWLAGGPGILHRGSLVICCISQMNIKSKVKYLDGFQYHAPAVFKFLVGGGYNPSQAGAGLGDNLLTAWCLVLVLPQLLLGTQQRSHLRTATRHHQ